MGNGEGYSVIPSSTKRENTASNLLALELHLDAEDKKSDRGTGLQRSSGQPGRSGP